MAGEIRKGRSWRAKLFLSSLSAQAFSDSLLSLQSLPDLKVDNRPRLSCTDFELIVFQSFICSEARESLMWTPFLTRSEAQVITSLRSSGLHPSYQGQSTGSSILDQREDLDGLNQASFSMNHTLVPAWDPQDKTSLKERQPLTCFIKPATWEGKKRKNKNERDRSKTEQGKEHQKSLKSKIRNLQIKW